METGMIENQWFFFFRKWSLQIQPAQPGEEKKAEWIDVVDPQFVNSKTLNTNTQALTQHTDIHVHKRTEPHPSSAKRK